MESKDLRCRTEYFPEADKLVFDTGKKGFVPLPIAFRKLLRYLTPPELRVFIYLSMRASKYGICYPSNDEMIHELGLTSKKNLDPHVKSLREKRFISVAHGGGKHYYLIHKPEVVIRHLLETGQIDDSALREINELLKDLGQTPIEPPKSTQPVHQAVGLPQDLSNSFVPYRESFVRGFGLSEQNSRLQNDNGHLPGK